MLVTELSQLSIRLKIMINNVEFIAVQDTVLSEHDLKEFQKEVIFTLQRGDFLRMPEMDFEELAQTDPEIYALLN